MAVIQTTPNVLRVNIRKYTDLSNLFGQKHEFLRPWFRPLLQRYFSVRLQACAILGNEILGIVLRRHSEFPSSSQAAEAETISLTLFIP